VESRHENSTFTMKEQQMCNAIFVTSDRFFFFLVLFSLWRLGISVLNGYNLFWFFLHGFALGETISYRAFSFCDSVCKSEICHEAPCMFQ
jgi:hypothetical protein